MAVKRDHEREKELKECSVENRQAFTDSFEIIKCMYNGLLGSQTGPLLATVSFELSEPSPDEMGRTQIRPTIIISPNFKNAISAPVKHAIFKIISESFGLIADSELAWDGKETVQ